MDERTQKYANNLSKLIRKETVSVEGQFDKAKFDEFHELLKEVFPNLFKVVEYEEFDGSILLIWRGKNKDAMPIMLMNHHDVVEAQGEWTHPAFSGKIAEDKVWGRGALDTKGGLLGMLQAADELAAEGFVPNVDIYFESSCNEETDGSGANAISQELFNRRIKFSMILDEGGMIMYEPIDGAKGTFAMVGMGEKGNAELQFIARSNGGHASTPEKDTPLVRLGKFMAEVDSSKIFDVEISPVINEMFKRLAPSVKGPLGKIFAKPEAFGPVLKLAMPKASAIANALLQSTIAFTMAQGSEARNVIPAEASVVGNMRISHHQGYASSLSAVKKIADKYDLEIIELSPSIDSPLADFNSDGFKLIEAAVNHSFKDVSTVPYVMTGASDSRFMGKVSDSCFHFVPFIINEQQLESIHGINENVDVATLAPAVDFYRYIISEAK